MKLIAHLIDYEIYIVENEWRMKSFWRFDDSSQLNVVRSRCSAPGTNDIEVILAENYERLIQRMQVFMDKTSRLVKDGT